MEAAPCICPEERRPSAASLDARASSWATVGALARVQRGRMATGSAVTRRSVENCLASGGRDAARPGVLAEVALLWAWAVL